MKKSELKQGTAYLVTSRGVNSYSSSIFKLTQQNRWARRYVIFSAGEADSPYKTPSMVWVTPCPTYGEDCQTHSELYPNGSRRGCPRDKARLMDIQGEFYPQMAKIARRYAERSADGGRGERYLRHIQRKAQREREAITKPIKEEMYALISEITGTRLSPYYSDLNRLDNEQMTRLIQAIKAGKEVNA